MWLTFWPRLSFRIAVPTAYYLWPKTDNSLMGSNVDKAKLTSSVFWPRSYSQSLYDGCYYHEGVEFLSCWTALTAFGAQHLKSLQVWLVDIVSAVMLSLFISIYSELYQYWSTKHTGLAFFDECPISWPLKPNEKLNNVLSSGYCIWFNFRRMPNFCLDFVSM